ncbi:MAG: phosphate/phosphite/phosphonate ABC transporter substrate-binding protein [Pseudomonadota bacterium]
MKTFCIKIAVAVALLILCFSAPLVHAGSYVFGVHPYKNPAELAKMFKPLMAHLETQTGTTLSFRSSKDYAAFNEAFIKGDIDIAFMGPSIYAELSGQHPDKIRLVATTLHNGQPTFKGVIIAKKDSSINTLADLKGKKIALGDRDSTLSCYLPVAMLMDAGVFDSITYDFTGKHDNVAMSVLKGVHDAGGLKPDVAEKYMDQGLKVIAESIPVYEHVIVVGSKVDDATMKKIQDALVNGKDPAVYTSIQKSYTGFTDTTKPEDYASLLDIIKKVDAKIAR